MKSNIKIANVLPSESELELKLAKVSFCIKNSNCSNKELFKT